MKSSFYPGSKAIVSPHLVNVEALIVSQRAIEILHCNFYPRSQDDPAIWAARACTAGLPCKDVEHLDFEFEDIDVGMSMLGYGRKTERELKLERLYSMITMITGMHRVSVSTQCGYG